MDYNNQSILLNILNNPGTTFVTERILNIFADFLPSTCWIIPTSVTTYGKKYSPIVYVDFLVTIEEEAGFFNFETNEISLPQSGFQTKLEAELMEFSYISADFGRI